MENGTGSTRLCQHVMCKHPLFVRILSYTDLYPGKIHASRPPPCTMSGLSARISVDAVVSRSTTTLVDSLCRFSRRLTRKCTSLEISKCVAKRIFYHRTKLPLLTAPQTSLPFPKRVPWIVHRWTVGCRIGNNAETRKTSREREEVSLSRGTGHRQFSNFFPIPSRKLLFSQLTRLKRSS